MTLQCANISILDNRLCRWAYPGHISEKMLCAGLWEGGRGSCQVSHPLQGDGGLSLDLRVGDGWKHRLQDLGKKGPGELG